MIKWFIAVALIFISAAVLFYLIDSAPLVGLPRRLLYVSLGFIFVMLMPVLALVFVQGEQEIITEKRQ